MSLFIYETGILTLPNDTLIALFVSSLSGSKSTLWYLNCLKLLVLFAYWHTNCEHNEDRDFISKYHLLID